MNNKYRILHLEDVATDAELIKRVLENSNVQFDSLVIDTELQYVKALDEFKPDVILCDHTLPSFNSFEALAILKAKKLNIPFIIITATMTEDVAMNMVREGADDYILKDRLQRLPYVVLNAIDKYRFEKERKQFVDEAYEKEAAAKELLVRLSGKLLLAAKVAGVGVWEYVIATNEFVADHVMYQLYGIRPGDFDGTYNRWMEYIHPEDRERIHKQFQGGLQSSHEFNLAFRIIHPNQSVHYIDGSAIVERNNQRKSIRMVGTNQDVTARKIAEQAIHINMAERENHITELTSSVKDLKEFSYVTSHNFKAPLTNLIALLTLIDYSSLSDDNREIAELFRISTHKLNKVIDDLLETLVVENNANTNIAGINIGSMLDDVCGLFSYDIKHTNCVIHKNLQVTVVDFNKAYLESILMNLISNAFKYRSPNRLLQIDISTEQKTNGEIMMTIEDNGIGIDLEKNYNNVFGLHQRFHTNADGVGLGLFIVKSQLNALGAKIDVKSTIDKGTAFYITFKKTEITKAA